MLRFGLELVSFKERPRIPLASFVVISAWWALFAQDDVGILGSLNEKFSKQ